MEDVEDVWSYDFRQPDDDWVDDYRREGDQIFVHIPPSVAQLMGDAEAEFRPRARITDTPRPVNLPNMPIRCGHDRLYSDPCEECERGRWGGRGYRAAAPMPPEDRREYNRSCWHQRKRRAAAR